MIPNNPPLHVIARCNKPISSLMIEGSKKLPKTTEDFFDLKNDQIVAACAMGAAAYAAVPDGTPKEQKAVALKICYYLATKEVKSPPADCAGMSEDLTADNVVVYLNDEVGWSRTRIAKWLKSIGL